MSIPVSCSIDFSRLCECAQIFSVEGAAWAPLNEAQRKVIEYKVTNEYTEALRNLAPDTGAYVNEVSCCIHLTPSPMDIDSKSSRRMHSNLTFNKSFGVTTTEDYLPSSGRLIQRICCGVELVLGMSAGRRSDINYVEYNIPGSHISHS